MSTNRLAALDNETTSTTLEHAITAIDIVLEPDATMIQHAQAANAALLKNFPKGYALGDEHAPHISVMGGYVYTASLDKIFAAASKVLASRLLRKLEGCYSRRILLNRKSFRDHGAVPLGLS